MHNNTYTPTELRKQRVLEAIRKHEDNIDIRTLETATGMPTADIAAVIETLARENRILLRLNHSDDEACLYLSQSETLYERFKDLLFVHRGKQRSVAFYASRLCITPKHLYATVKRVSGKTPAEWIREEALKEIEFLLCHTQASIKEIVYELDFPNLSFFGKFFKAHKGMSPKLYRTLHARSHTPGADAP